MITQEEGKDQPKIEFYRTEIVKINEDEKIDFDEFIEILTKAKKHLIEE